MKLEINPETVIQILRQRISDLEYQLTLYQAAEVEQAEAAAAQQDEKQPEADPVG